MSALFVVTSLASALPRIIGARSSQGQAVEVRRVAAGDLLLVGRVEAGDRARELGGGAGVLGVGMREVRRPDDPVHADDRRPRRELEQRFVHVEADPALAAEDLRRLLL